MATVESPLLRPSSQHSSPPDITQKDSQRRCINIHSRSAKILAVYWTFLIMGAGDAAYGPLIPYIESYYSISYTVVSLLFLSPVCGYTLAAILNHEIHVRLGRRGVACIHSFCHLFTFIVASLHPPYPILVLSLAVGGIANGVADSGWNAWIGDMANSNELLGMLHGLYGVGAVVSPLLASLLISKANCPWFRFYNVMAGFAVIEAIVSISAFWKSGPEEFQDNDSIDENQRGGLRRVLTQKPYALVTWCCASYLLIYVGIEVAMGGWTVTYMMKVRDGDPFASGMVATGFWLGLTFGRFVLGFVTSRIGTSFAITAYSSAAFLFTLAFWILPNFYAAAVAIALQGFFLGPLFPSMIVVVTRILPRSLHVSSIGFASAVGGAGAAVLPFTVGAIAQSRGVGVLPVFIIGLLGGLFTLWLCLSRMLRLAEES
ncbi:uncharacterized protein N7469_003756 [Penicillium citrinum]|uniref:Major facilitator superfamily (MFS) profile domain-containing protein n=1 Tax=Penicillium citrinum TaxID=5077 RepID=A0A9W9P3A7_PENCI|nr:uncharacterized protein N7469_003756 [Penicillium citrinum]KAJ5234588.1 hypothetical protein N7469_003756 [Penicillium citrinum]